MDKQASFAKKLTHILLRNKVISEKEANNLQQLFKESSKENFDDFLLEEGLVSKEDLLNALSQLYKVPAVDVTGYFFQTFLLHKFPKDILHRYAFIPMEADDDIMSVVASEPDDPGLMLLIGGFVPDDVVFYVGIRRDITDAFSEYYDKAVTEVPQDIDSRLDRLKKLGSRETQNEPDDVEDIEDRGSLEELTQKESDDEYPISDEDMLD